jgi:hypothetical protein
MLLLFTLITLLIETSSCPPVDEATKENMMGLIEKQFMDEVYINKLMFVLRVKESRHNYNAIGLNGEIGAYQFMKPTWNSLSLIFFSKILKPTKEKQDSIAYKVLESYVKKGYSTQQIAAIWNSGKPNCRKSGINSAGIKYDVGAYVVDFMNIYRNLNKQENPVFFQPGFRLFDNN